MPSMDYTDLFKTIRLPVHVLGNKTAINFSGIPRAGTGRLANWKSEAERAVVPMRDAELLHWNEDTCGVCIFRQTRIRLPRLAD